MYKYLGSTLFGIWFAQGKQSICFLSRCPHDINCSFAISNPSIAHLGIMGAKQEDIIQPHFPISCEPSNLFLSLTSERISVTDGQCFIISGAVVTRLFLRSLVCECFRIFESLIRNDDDKLNWQSFRAFRRSQAATLGVAKSSFTISCLWWWLNQVCIIHSRPRSCSWYKLICFYSHRRLDIFPMVQATEVLP
jgi:hypothetical protein